jgi:hypothetical protein
MGWVESGGGMRALCSTLNKQTNMPSDCVPNRRPTTACRCVGKFVITKQLTKRLEDYPDARVQPHVQVALRRRAAGRKDGTNPGETVPYVICVRLDAAATAAAAAGGEPAAQQGGEEQQQQQQQQQQDGGASGSGAAAAPAATPAKPAVAGGGQGHIAERAFHPDELREDATLAIDRE